MCPIAASSVAALRGLPISVGHHGHAFGAASSGTRSTAFTPFTARAALSSTEARRAPNTGRRATTAVS